jgi:lambda repressor-like predicted transcriptional regulator
MKKDFNVKITVRNNHLLSAVVEKFGNGAELCRQAGFSPSILAAYMTMKLSPVGLSGWKNTALNLATALNMYPSDLWPEHMQNVKLKTATAEVELDAKEVRAIIAGGHEIDQIAAADLLDKISDDLPPRSKAFMKWRIAYGSDATYDECGKLLGVTRERARQIECKALRIMRGKAKRLGVESISEFT